MVRDWKAQVALIVVVLALTGCGGRGSAGTVPPTVNGNAQTRAQGGPWMLQEAKSDDLLYLSDAGRTGNVYVYSYPQGKHVGTLTGFTLSAYECTDTKGDIFITNQDLSNSDIVEYAHGGTEPIATLSDSEAPLGCSFDPTTGNLAVVNADDVLIYADAQGQPTTYSSQNIKFITDCAYDASGDLFVSGGYAGDALFELPSGSSTFTGISITAGGIIPRGDFDQDSLVFWDGQYVVVAAAFEVPYRRHGTKHSEYYEETTAYRIAVSGSSGTIAGAEQLGHAQQDLVPVPQFWIGSGRVSQPNDFRHGANVMTWQYPAGKQLGDFAIGVGSFGATGAVVSLAQSSDRKR